jgi:UPF0755 protein
MFKKVLSVFLIFIFVFLLASCGSDSDSSSESNIFSPDGSAQTQAVEESSESDGKYAKVTVPEGYTLLKTAWLLEENGICSTDDFLNAVSNYDTSKYSILSSIHDRDKICFLLEGYLFPATYTFEKNSDPTEVIDEMVATEEKKFTDEMKQRATELGYSVHDILTIASIIEKEAFTDEQRTLVSSTIHNRLKQGMRLEYDVTVKYCTGVIELQYPDKIDYYKYYYNGNRCDGLIAGPICNPGTASINAALYPADTDYLYFVIDTNPPYNSAFTNSYDEHLKNVQKWKNGEL